MANAGPEAMAQVGGVLGGAANAVAELRGLGAQAEAIEVDGCPPLFGKMNCSIDHNIVLICLIQPPVSG